MPSYNSERETMAATCHPPARHTPFGLSRPGILAPIRRHSTPASGTNVTVDASRVRIPVPVRSRPRWSRRIPTRIAHGIGHGQTPVFMESLWQQGCYPKVAESAPNSTDRPSATEPDIPSIRV